MQNPPISRRVCESRIGCWLAYANRHPTGEQTRAKPAIIPLANIALMLSGGRIGFPEGHNHSCSAI
jgi:hypothetical protein